MLEFYLSQGKVVYTLLAESFKLSCHTANIQLKQNIIEGISFAMTLVCSADISEDLGRSIFLALPKEPGVKKYELNLTIGLMSHVIKLIIRHLINRVCTAEIDRKEGKNGAGA